MLRQTLAAFALFTAPLVAQKPIAIFNGDDLSNWTVDIPKSDKNPDEALFTFYVGDGLLKTTGKPLGHLISQGSYSDYVLTIEYRYPGKAGNCGVMIHCSTPRFLNGIFPRSVEVQLMSGRAGDIISIGENVVGHDKKSTPDAIGKARTRVIPRLVKDAEKNVGEWNTMVILCQGNALAVTVNGHLMNVLTDMSTSSGKIALQSEGVPVDFRKVSLKPLPKAK